MISKAAPGASHIARPAANLGRFGFLADRRQLHRALQEIRHMVAEGEHRLVAVVLDGAGGLVGTHRLMLAGLVAPGSSVAPAARFVAGFLPASAGRLCRCSFTHLGLLRPALDRLLGHLTVGVRGGLGSCLPRARVFAGLATAPGALRWP